MIACSTYGHSRPCPSMSLSWSSFPRMPSRHWPGQGWCMSWYTYYNALPTRDGARGRSRPFAPLAIDCCIWVTSHVCLIRSHITSARAKCVPSISRHARSLVSGSRTVRLLQLYVTLVVAVSAMKPGAHATEQVESRARVRAVLSVTHDPAMLPAKSVEGSGHAEGWACQGGSVCECGSVAERHGCAAYGDSCRRRRSGTSRHPGMHRRRCPAGVMLAVSRRKSINTFPVPTRSLRHIHLRTATSPLPAAIASVSGAASPPSAGGVGGPGISASSVTVSVPSRLLETAQTRPWC
jgi:hypothetical protein